MKKGLTFFMAALMLVFSLTACGGNDKQQDPQNDSAIVDDDTASNSDNGSNTDSNSNSGNNSSNMPGNNSGNGNAASGDNSEQDTNSGGLDDALTGDSATNNTGGVTYEQMLRNARVHDRDGDLTDHENAATPGTTF